MKTIQSTSTKKGQTTIPATIRKRLGLTGSGHYLWVIDQDEIRVKPADYTLESAYASLPFSLGTDELDQVVDEVREERAAAVLAKLNQS